MGSKKPLIDSLWWRNAPLRVYPNKISLFSLTPSSFFPPVPGARETFMCIIVYACYFLAPRWTHNDISRSFSLSQGFLPLRYIIYCPLPPLLSVCAPQKHPLPWILLSISFFWKSPIRFVGFCASSFIYIYLYAVFLYIYRRVKKKTPRHDDVRHSEVPRRRHAGRLLSAAKSGSFFRYLSRFLLSVRTNKMAACCFYSSDTGGGLEVQQH